MKKPIIAISSFLAGALIMASIPVFSSTGLQKITANINHTIFLKLNGQKVETEYPIITYNGRTYVYLKEVGELVGASVEWNNDERSVEIMTIYQNDEEKNLSLNEIIPPIETKEEIVLEKGIWSINVYNFYATLPSKEHLRHNPYIKQIFNYMIQIEIPDDYPLQMRNLPKFEFSYLLEGNYYTNIIPLDAVDKVNGHRGFDLGINTYKLALPIEQSGQVKEYRIRYKINDSEYSDYFVWNVFN